MNVEKSAANGDIVNTEYLNMAFCGILSLFYYAKTRSIT